MCKDLAILTQYGWRVSMGYTDSAPAGFDVVAVRGDFIIELEYLDDNGDVMGMGTLSIKTDDTVARPVRDLTWLDMRKIAAKTNEEIDKIVVIG